MANIKSSKDVANQATNNLDPNIGKIASQTEAIASTLSQQSSAIQQLKESLSRNEASNEEGSKKITSSLLMANKQISIINKNITMMTKQVSSMTSVVSNMSMNSTASISLLGGIQTSLVQITSVLSAFRADYLLASSGNKLDGTGYYDVNLLKNIANNLKGVKNAELQKQIQSIVKAANYANKASNSVRSKLGNGTRAKDDDELNFLDKILGKGQQLQGIAGLASLLLPGKAGKVAEKAAGVDLSSLGGLLGSFDKTKGLINPLQELGMDLGEKGGPFGKWLSEKMGDLGLKKEKKEREKDPNLVMSSLAPFADDIKDMVETSYQGLKERPKAIPIYATPVWVVNSKDQTNYIGKTSKKDTHGSDLEEKRVMEILEGLANNTKDKYGNDALSTAKKTAGYGQKRIERMRQDADNRVYQRNHSSLHDGSDISRQIRDIGNNGLGILENFDPNQGAQGLLSGVINAFSTGNTDTSALRSAGGVLRSLFPGSGSHSSGKKGTKPKGKLQNRNEQTVEHETAVIDQDTTILNAKDNKNAKTAKDILNGQLSVAAGLNALIDISTQENIFLSDAVNNGKIDPKNAKGYTSSFKPLEQLANQSGADNATKKAIQQFKKASDLSKIIKAPKIKNMTDDEYWGRDKEKEKEEDEKKINDTVENGINSLKEKLMKNKTVQAGIGVAKKVGKKLLNNKKVKAGIETAKKMVNGKTGKKILGVAEKIKDYKDDPTKAVSDALNTKTGQKLKEKAVTGVKSLAKKAGNKVNEKLSGTKVGDKLSDLKKMYQEELAKRKEDGKEEEKGAKDVAEQELKNATEEGIADKAATEQLAAEDKLAQDARNKTKDANDKVLAAQEKAADKAEQVQEETANAQEISLKQANATTEGAIQEAGATADGLGNTTGLISNIAAKLSGLPTPAKIALGVAGVAAVTAVGVKMIKMIKDAVKGKKSKGGDSKSSAKASKDQKKEVDKEKKKQEKEEKKREKAEKKAKMKAKVKRAMRSKLNFLTGGLTAAKVYIDDDGNVLKSKGDEPIKKLDENGNETEETLNIRDKDGKKQFIKRLMKHEFKMDKAKALGKALKKLGAKAKKALKGAVSKVKGGVKKIGGFIKKHKGAIASFAFGGIGGLAAYGMGKAVKGIIGKLTNKQDKKAARLNQLLLMSSSAYLFMDPKLQKQLDGIENSDFGKQLAENPEKASNLLFNASGGGVSTLLSKSKSKESTASSSLGSLLNKITDKITGEDDINKKYSSDAKDLSESGTLAGVQANQNEWRRRMLDAFSSSMGFSKGKTNDQGKLMTTSEIVNEERKKNAIKLGVVGPGSGVAGTTAASGSMTGGTLQTAIPYSTYATWKQGWSSLDGTPHWTNKGWNTKTAISIGNQTLGDAGCSLCSNALMLVHYGIVQDPNFDPGVFADDINSRSECAGACGTDAPMRHMCEYQGSTRVSYQGQQTVSNFDDAFNTIVSKMREGYIVIGHVTGHYCGPVDYVDLTNKVIYFMDPGYKANCWYDKDNPSPSLSNPSAKWTSEGDDAGYTSSSGPSGKSFMGIVLYKAEGVDPSVYLLNGRRTFDCLHETGNAPNATINPATTADAGASSAAVPSSGQLASEWFLNDLSAGNPHISSGVGPRWGTTHNGTDFACAQGTPIHTPVAGTVTAIGTGGKDNDASSNGGAGNYVFLKDDKGNVWKFMHFDQDPLVKQGDTVVAGQQLGVVGTTGHSTGYHLHVGLYDSSGKLMDTENYRFGTGKFGRENNKIQDEPKKDKKVYEFGGERFYVRDESSEAKASGSDNHIYQRDYSNYLFNINGDTEFQTLGDSGCGPAAATMVKRLYGNGKSKRLYRTGRATEEDTANATTTEGDEVKTTESEETSTATAGTDPQSALGKSASYTNDVGDTFTVTVEQEHIDIFNKCRACGCSDAAACGVLGNLHQETGGTGEKLRYWATNHTNYGGGIMQWTPWSKHVDWATQHNMDPWTWETNLEHMADELQNHGNWGNPKKASPSLESKGYTAYSSTAEWMATTDPASAAVNFERAFEVSGDWNGRNSEGVKYSENMIYDRKRVGPAMAYYDCFRGLGTSGAISSANVSSGNIGLAGWINLITDSAVDSSALSNYTSGSSLWDDFNKSSSSDETTTDSSTSSGSGRYGRGRRKKSGIGKKYNNTKIKVRFGKGSSDEGVGFANTRFVNTSANNPLTNSPSATSPSANPSSLTSSPQSSTSVGSVTSNISNTMSVTDTDENGKTTTTTNVYTDNNKTTLTTSGKSTIVICNNFAEKTKTDLTDVLNSFKHLNGTQNNALKVLKAISDLIKEENPAIMEEASRLRLDNDGLEFILKGF